MYCWRKLAGPKLRGLTMNRTTIMVVALSFLILSETRAQPESDAGDKNKAGAPTIVVTGLETNDYILMLRYEINNDSEQEVWICEDIAVFQDEFDFETYLAEDGHTLLIRRRLDVREVGSSLYAPPHGRYVRLSPGQIRTESLFLPLPVYPRRVFRWGAKPNGTVNAKRIAIEIGYYAGDMPNMIFSMLEEAEKSTNKRPVSYPIYPTNIKEWFGGRWLFNEISEWLRDRDEEIVIPWTGGIRMGEKVSQIVIDGQRIPYEEKHDSPPVSPPDLSSCTRVEIRYQPSMLEYFFPYTGQQNLLSPDEKKYLQSQMKVVADSLEHLKTFAEEIGKGFDGMGGVVTERSKAYVVCYRDDELLMSFTIYDDLSLMTKEKQVFRYKMGLPSLKALTPQICPFKQRVRCAANLRDLWHRLHLYYKAEKIHSLASSFNNKMAYTPSTEWCDFMVSAYRITMGNKSHKFMMRPFKCPSAEKGECHYAMNPNCKADSPADMVLLFETKGGWNQHGGPELFTFDNHNPKGGCVLLNDGTIKFIRTKEELQQLRWK